MFSFFFFNDTATTEIYTLSLHDALPIAHQFMVRCKIPGGVLTGEQYLVIDELADRYGNGTLRVTTRQGNQFHGVLKGDLKSTIRSVNDVLVKIGRASCRERV